MKFFVGYQAMSDSSFCDAVSAFKEHIEEVYFSFDSFPNGRNTTNSNPVFSKWEFMDKQREDLSFLHAQGIQLNLLLNGNCYGKDAQARGFFYQIGDALDYLGSRYHLTSVTTTSPLIARFIKQNFPDIEVRASVNMEIGSAEGMEYIADLFDSFYLKRENNRNLKKIKAARRWCDRNGKKLYGLANSGCLNFCPVHTFHDNLVSHENEIAQMDNAYQFEGQCRIYLQNSAKRDEWLKHTNFIRPEDTHLYEGLFDGLKLATRVHKNPAKVIEAYCRCSYNGAVTALLEPNHSDLFYPAVIDNKHIPADFTERVMRCSGECGDCEYCSKVQRNAAIILD